MKNLILLLLCLCGPVMAGQGSLQEAILSSHNTFRMRHHVSNLVWDSGLQAYAQRYADKCVFQHSASHYGENLAAGYPSPAAAIDAWHEEENEYSYWRPGFSHETGHFTQLVWKGTKKIGCGYRDCSGKNGTPGVYLVCEYSPAGNIINDGFFKRNVLSE